MILEKRVVHLVLYDGKNEVSEDVVLERVRQFYNQAEQAMKYWSDGDKNLALDLAKSLRDSLQAEYSNNSLKRIDTIYGNDKNFINYRAAVHETIASITGKTTYKNVYSFLYDVRSYMRYYFSKVDQ